MYLCLIEFFSSFIFAGLITGYLADKISIRWTVIFGAVLSLAGFTISAFGPNIYYTIIGYGVLTGNLPPVTSFKAKTNKTVFKYKISW